MTAFFTLVSLCIVCTMIIPKLFGLQSFTQWAGMYTDNWCNAWIYSDRPDMPNVQAQWINAGKDDGTVPVWSAPMFNQETCTTWIKDIVCGRQTAQGWNVRWAQPYFKKDYYLGDRNACDLAVTAPYDWFLHHDEIAPSLP